jgi:hypothetical protein
MIFKLRSEELILADKNNFEFERLVYGYEIWYPTDQKKTISYEEMGEIADEITAIFEKRNLHWKMV